MSEEQHETADETVPPKLRRTRRKRDRSSWNGWRSHDIVWNSLILLTVAAGAASLVYLSDWRPVGGVLLVVGLLAAVVRLHYNLLHHTRWWLDNCPRCETDGLRRLHRRRWHRLLDWVGIPVRPYICAECGWRGSRIDQTKIL